MTDNSIASRDHDQFSFCISRPNAITLSPTLLLGDAC